jgi:hypothetical protein
MPCRHECLKTTHTTPVAALRETEQSGSRGRFAAPFRRLREHG